MSLEGSEPVERTEKLMLGKTTAAGVWRMLVVAGTKSVGGHA